MPMARADAWTTCCQWPLALRFEIPNGAGKSVGARSQKRLETYCTLDSSYAVLITSTSNSALTWQAGMKPNSSSTSRSSFRNCDRPGNTYAALATLCNQVPGRQAGFRGHHPELQSIIVYNVIIIRLNTIIIDSRHRFRGHHTELRSIIAYGVPGTNPDHCPPAPGPKKACNFREGRIFL
jgi:hypothetical protein